MAMSRALLVTLSLALGMAGCAQPNTHPPAISLRAGSAIERRATLSLLKRAWEERPQENTDDHCWYERRLLDRSAFFGRKIRDTESYREVCNFWMLCVREHIEKYDDNRYTQR